MAVSKVSDNEAEGTSREDNDHVPFLEENTTATEKKTIKNDLDNANHKGLVQRPQNSVKDPKSEKDSVVEDEPLQVLVTVPPDGGWGWMVVAASFIANFIVDGILYCYGVFIPIIMKDFKESSAKVSIPGSLLAGFYLMTGPLVSVLANKYGFQKVTVAGAIFAAVSFALSGLAMNVEYLIFTYGVLGGIGFGMVYSPSIVAVGYYFERFRGIATGIAVCGSGIGTFALSPINDLFIKAVGWKKTLFIQAAIILLLAICGMMYRPIKPVKIAINENLDDNEDVKPEDPLKSKEPLPEPIKKSGSFVSLKSSKPPTAAEILQITGRPISTDTTTTKLSKSSQSLNVNNLMIGKNADVEKGEKRRSVPNIEEDGIGPMGVPNSKKQRSMSQVTVPGKPGKRKRTISEVSSNLSQGQSVECIIRSRRGTITQVDEKVNVPIQRDDMYFSGSLTRLPQYKPEKDSISYTLSVTRIPPKKGKSRISPADIWRIISELFDFSLLLSPSFNLLLFSGLLTMLGYFTPFSYLKDRAMKEGNWRDGDTVWLISTIGITNTVGRVLSGFISGLPGMDATFINNIALMVAGIATMISGISFSTPYQFAYCAIFGLSTAAFASLRSIMVVDLLGLENLNNAFGILLFVQGFGSALGSPLSGNKKNVHWEKAASYESLSSIGFHIFPVPVVSEGMVYKATESYEASFYFSGTLIFLSGLVLFPLNAINRWEKRKKNIQKNTQQHQNIN